VKKVSDNIGSHETFRPQYPMSPAGGLFIALVGAGLIAAVGFSGAALVNYIVFFVGSGLGIMALLFAGRLSIGKPTRIQIFTLAAAIVLELALFIIMGRMLPPGTGESVRWKWVSMIVGVHFLPMAISFGPRLLVLGAFCIVISISGLFLSNVPSELFLLLDGAAKLLFGLWLFSDRWMYARR
jgi:hypothetical protein